MCKSDKNAFDENRFWFRFTVVYFSRLPHLQRFAKFQAILLKNAGDRQPGGAFGCVSSRFSELWCGCLISVVVLRWAAVDCDCTFVIQYALQPA
jgi:hypothetical protein